MVPSRLTNLSSLAMSHIVWVFHLPIHIENVLQEEEEVHRAYRSSQGCLRTNSLVNQPCHATNGSTSENGHLSMAGLDLLGGSWNRSTQGKGCSHSHYVGFPRKRANSMARSRACRNSGTWGFPNAAKVGPKPWAHQEDK